MKPEAQAPPPATLLVSEVYPAIQGEGPCAGTPCVMVRLHGCPVHCQWCDTAYTWDGSEKGRRVEVGMLFTEIEALRMGHIVITGGEPLIQPGVADLLRRLIDWGFGVEVETSGVVPPPNVPGVRWNVSPKLPGARAKMAPNLKTLRQFPPDSTHWKFVITGEADLRAAEDMANALGLASDRFWLMPEGKDRETLGTRLAWLQGLIIERRIGCRVSGRLHIVAYGGLRGV